MRPTTAARSATTAVARSKSCVISFTGHVHLPSLREGAARHAAAVEPHSILQHAGPHRGTAWETIPRRRENPRAPAGGLAKAPWEASNHLLAKSNKRYHTREKGLRSCERRPLWLGLNHPRRSHVRSQAYLATLTMTLTVLVWVPTVALTLTVYFLPAFRPFLTTILPLL